MKNIFIKAYFKRNLGDDLFIKILSEKYNENFYAICSPKYKYQKSFPNIHFNSSYIKYYFYRIYERLARKNELIEKKELKKAELMLNIGGSIFIENNNWQKRFDLYKKDIPYYIIGANFGPYHTEEYQRYIENQIFKNAISVSMRDKASCSIFDLPNIQYAPDIVFSLNLKDIHLTNNKKVIISVMDFSKRANSEIKEQYENKIIELINFFYKKGFQITLMSFCKNEGDEKAIKRILRKLKNNTLNKKIKKYYYRENIQEALNILGDSQIIIGSRFHANILGLLMGKTIIPISYSNKTIDMLSDLNFKGKIINMNKLASFNVNSLTDYDLNYKIDVSKQKVNSLLHFKILATILQKNKK